MRIVIDVDGITAADVTRIGLGDGYAAGVFSAVVPGFLDIFGEGAAVTMLNAAENVLIDKIEEAGRTQGMRLNVNSISFYE